MVFMKIKRLIYRELEKQIYDPKISILIGPRQVGKTFLMRELATKARKDGLRYRYFDLEQPNDMLSLGATDKEQFDTLVNSGEVVFVDELHLLKNISHIFKAIYDSQHKIKIFASGSSSLEMHKHLKESMAGRIIYNKIYPLTIRELKQIKDYTQEEILIIGGMPGLISYTILEEKIKQLQMIVSTYINRDIKGLIREENIRAFNHLMYILAEKQGSVIVSANLANDIGLSKPTIDKYLEILSQTYVCYTVHSYAKNLSNELKKSKKHYLFDIGIRNCLLKDFSPISERKDTGFLKESFVYLSIVKQLKANMEVRFWRTKQGHEVDFVILKNRRPFLIEVKSNLLKPEIPDGIKKFLDYYPNSTGAIIYNDNISCRIQYANKNVQFEHWTKAEKIDFIQSVV